MLGVFTQEIVNLLSDSTW